MNVLRKKAMPRYLSRHQDGEGQDSFKERIVLDERNALDSDRRQSSDGDIHNVCYRHDETWNRNMYPARDG